MPFATTQATTTAGSQESPDDAAPLLATLRWVWPSDNRVTVLSSTPAILGRDATSTTQLDAPRVSRRHAEIAVTPSGAQIIDLNSKNGIFVNGTKRARAGLVAGDVLRLGDCVAVFEAITPSGLSGFGQLGHGILGGATMRQLVARARRTAEGTLSVVLTGATGTGKERFARAIHGFSGRTGPFLAVNCAAYSEATASAELFGYRRGAFTGADSAGVGHVRAAHGGTLFLDEILDLPLPVQATLLRVLEEREVLPLGETQPRSIDVRFLSATQVPLAQAVAEGRFRGDLRARLEGAVLELPSLKARRGDVIPLFLEFLAQHGEGWKPKLDPLLAERLCLYDWPLNVRELENAARRAVSECRGLDVLSLRRVQELNVFEPLPSPKTQSPASPDDEKAFATRRVQQPYAQTELSALKAALDRHGGNLTQAASELGIGRSKAYRMLKCMPRDA
jgi:DNA-binding NtrC family response regulator